ncbi:MAG: translation elongation factor Ts [Alphaproteobacteria bacterium]|jgi:elongation factor Ts|uniref:translation elongation factor Ts n=1 Tax=Pacificispira sp. TaxID=2888761 RepID=UPI003304A3F6
MGQISASMVKDLREKTGAGMMDCKKALAETDGDMEAAVDWLRKKGLAAAAKKSGRVASDGLVAVVTEGTSGAAVEINAETDFVARNESFQSFVSEVAKIALAHGGDAAQTQAAAYPGTGRTVEEQLTHNIATIGENMSFRRSVALTVENGIVAGYVHSATAPGLGKIGVLVALESTGDTAKLEALGKQIAMHVAAARPEALKVEDVDSSNLERERAVLVEQAKASGKPDNIIEKMVEGRIRKYYEEVVLLEQVYVIDGETRVKKIVEDAAKDVGAPVTLAGFVRYELGEGIAKKEEDFAAEVAAAMKS